MNLQELKNKIIREELEIGEDYGEIFSFIDFANVNKWFEDDKQDWNNKPLESNEKLEIDVQKLKIFGDVFSNRVRIYYGQDLRNSKSQSFTYFLRKVFNNKVVTKDLQRIKHYLDNIPQEQLPFTSTDKQGYRYIEIHKCNFDVEISVDAIKMIDHYDTFCIFSGDADFVYLNNFLRKKKKKVIIFKSGHITNLLRRSADLIINAQRVKKHIARIEKTKT
ncbi:MAG: NYN domain-containing protein [Candidatus Paceibacterota bacterium]